MAIELNLNECLWFDTPAFIFCVIPQGVMRVEKYSLDGEISITPIRADKCDEPLYQWTMGIYPCKFNDLTLDIPFRGLPCGG